ENEQAVILLDALDEAEWRRGVPENVFYLPPVLPERMFIVVTTRHREDLPLRFEQGQVFYLEPDSPGNREDALAYITRFARREAIQSLLVKWGVTEATFAHALLIKSEGNFMYLRHVLPAIEAGQFIQGTLAELPQGLKSYYEHHWRQMRAIDEE